MRLPIYLIGFMGAGKTTIGQLLATKLNWSFVDLDNAFREIHGLSTADYIRQYGMQEFRIKEKYVVEDLAELPYEKVIYATGGGYPCWEDNMQCLHELGTSIYIRWQPQHLAKRLVLTNLEERPLLRGCTEEELTAFITPLLREREPYYSQADLIIDAPLSEVDANADNLLSQHLYHLISKH